jgi:hypothetical protein
MAKHLIYSTWVGDLLSPSYEKSNHNVWTKNLIKECSPRNW